MDPTAPTILRPRVWSPSTTSLLYHYKFELWWEKDENKQKRLGLVHLKNERVRVMRNCKKDFFKLARKEISELFPNERIGFWLKIDNWRRVHLWRLATQISGLPRLKSKRLRDAITCGKRYIVLGRKFSSAAVKRASLMMEKIENILCIEFTNAFLPNASRMKMSLNDN